MSVKKFNNHDKQEKKTIRIKGKEWNPLHTKGSWNKAKNNREKLYLTGALSTLRVHYGLTPCF